MFTAEDFDDYDDDDDEGYCPGCGAGPDEECDIDCESGLYDDLEDIDEDE